MPVPEPEWVRFGLGRGHHVASRIPNYKLQQCFREVSELQQVTRLGFWESLGCLRLKLWDEGAGRLVGFRHLSTSPQ